MSNDIKIKPWDKKTQYRYAHVKRDGMWITLIKTQGSVKAWTRLPTDYTDILSWHNAVIAFKHLAPAHSIIWCEAFVANGTRNDVKAAIRDKSAKLRLECFAVYQWDKQHINPRTPLQEGFDLCKGLGIKFVQWFDHPYDLNKRAHDSEGWVLKDGMLLNWTKVKDEITYDLRVIGFAPARPGTKYDGKIGSMILADASGREVARASGMPDNFRDHMTQWPQFWVGKIVEVEAQGRGSAGGLSHPRFVRLRDDKDTADLLEVSNASSDT